ncbi:DUF6130 family protein [Dyella subtropica]|uniref:DUF6130 family protein n=1 Tax=Dyella subtropica TaxID=2992127 RepID=UPI002251E004|nr:DUF6130 family protein [Dyella subtropica]
MLKTSRSSIAFAFLLFASVPAVFAQEHAMPATAAAAAMEAPATLTVEPAIAGPLAKGLAVIPFHATHVKIMPVYGQAALGVQPRLGHLHVSVDGSAWHWLQASDEPVVIQGLPAGRHSVRLELADANHRELDVKTVEFEIPKQP